MFLLCSHNARLRCRAARLKHGEEWAANRQNTDPRRQYGQLGNTFARTSDSWFGTLYVDPLHEPNSKGFALHIPHGAIFCHSSQHGL